MDHRQAAREGAFGALKRAATQPPSAAASPDSPLAKRLQQIAQVVRADLGLEVAVTDRGGWDTHAGQGAARGQLASRLDDLAHSLAAFASDVGPALDRLCVVSVTEFGRTAPENGTKGTDHGHGSVMMLLGGRVRGNRVYGSWKGLAAEHLYEGRDLPVMTDHRQVFAEVLRGHMKARNLAAVFPGFTVPAKRLGLFG